MTSEDEQGIYPCGEPPDCPDCGKPANSFACKIRHVGVSIPKGWGS